MAANVASGSCAAIIFYGDWLAASSKRTRPEPHFAVRSEVEQDRPCQISTQRSDGVAARREWPIDLANTFEQRRVFGKDLGIGHQRH